MTSNGSRLLFVGLPGSGKTTYLAALWHLMEAVEIPSSLSAESLQPDRTYLNRIRDNWLSFDEVGRTSLRDPETVNLVLRESRTLRRVDVTLPDLSGESFQLQWTNRYATREYNEYVKDCTGILLFVHPLELRHAPLISHVPNDGEEVTASSGSISGVSDEPHTETVEEWAADKTPTQVQLVELIQFVKWLPPVRRHLRLSIIVSAWDRVREPLLSPASWVERRAPLLSQFLLANHDELPFRIYGVSALGGDLKLDIAALKSESVASRRVRVVEGRVEPHHDLTAPVSFLLGLDRGSDVV